MQEFVCINGYLNMAGVGDGFIPSPFCVLKENDVILWHSTPEREIERERMH